jgi:hypothetical protein
VTRSATRIGYWRTASTPFHQHRLDHDTQPSNFSLAGPERLKEDFADAAVFLRDPIIPPEWRGDFDFKVILQDVLTPETTEGVLYLTNIHRLYEDRAPKPQNPVATMVGPRVNKDSDSVSAEELFDRIAGHDRLLVVNDEAHHVHDKDLQWWKTIERLYVASGEGVVAQLDFSATPKDQQGQLFREIVVDYPLAQAVEDGIVKTPLIGEIGGPVAVRQVSAASLEPTPAGDPPKRGPLVCARPPITSLKYPSHRARPGPKRLRSPTAGTTTASAPSPFATTARPDAGTCASKSQTVDE